MRRLITALAITVIALVGLTVYLVYTRFITYQAAVDRIVVDLPSEERDLSAEVRDVIERLQGPAISWSVSCGLLLDIVPSQVKIDEWHLRGGLWEHLLPLRLARRDLISLYAHYMVFEGGRGVAYGARHYYAKSPAALTVEEAVSLVAISRGPDMYSPQHHRERYEYLYQKLLAQYHAAG